jgi:hypothetical protein
MTKPQGAQAPIEEQTMMRFYKVYYRGTGNFELIDALSPHQAKLLMALKNNLPLNALHRLTAERA